MRCRDSFIPWAHTRRDWLQHVALDLEPLRGCEGDLRFGGMPVFKDDFSRARGLTRKERLRLTIGIAVTLSPQADADRVRLLCQRTDHFVQPREAIVQGKRGVSLQRDDNVFLTAGHQAYFFCVQDQEALLWLGNPCDSPLALSECLHGFS
mgnify:CR=1 FL=1